MAPDARVYRPKADPGPLEQELAGAPRVVRAILKGRTLASLVRGSLTFTEGDVRFTVSDVTYDAERSLLSCWVAASDSNGTIPLDNPYQFVNPPVKIPDGTFHQETVVRRADPLITERVDVPNYVEDPLAAFKAIVVEAVTVVARSKGWGG